MADIQRESVEDALENDRCGICGSVDHFREDHPVWLDGGLAVPAWVADWIAADRG